MIIILLVLIGALMLLFTHQPAQQWLLRQRPVRRALQLAGFIVIEGQAEVKHYGANGVLLGTRTVTNLIVNNGRYGICDQLLASPTITKPTHMGIGTGTTAPALGDTALQTEVGTRQSASKSRSNNVLTLEATFAAGNGTGAITEAGVFNASTGGTLYSRITFSVINKGSNDSLTLTWTWTIGT
jgi:hypothetical protein